MTAVRRRARAFVAGLTMLAAACDYDKADYSPTAPNLAEVLTIAVVGGSSVPADGFSRLRIEARFGGAPALDRRGVIFSTSNGTLDGGEAVSSCAGCRKVMADETGRAAIDLVASQRVGSAQVSAASEHTPGIVANLIVEFVAADPDGTVRFVAAPTRAPADGATLTPFVVEVSPSVPASARQVSFATTSTAGFAPAGATTVSSVPVDGGGRATADLRSPGTIGSAQVSATVNGVTRSTSIQFERALPNAITVAVDDPIAPAALDTKITVTATLRRDVGSVTDGTVGTFSATRAGGATVGIFSNVGVSAAGVVTAEFLPQTTEAGTVTVTVGAQGTAVTGTVQVVLTAP